MFWKMNDIGDVGEVETKRLQNMNLLFFFAATFLPTTNMYCKCSYTWV